MPTGSPSAVRAEITVMPVAKQPIASRNVRGSISVSAICSTSLLPTTAHHRYPGGAHTLNPFLTESNHDPPEVGARTGRARDVHGWTTTDAVHYRSASGHRFRAGRLHAARRHRGAVAAAGSADHLRCRFRRLHHLESEGCPDRRRQAHGAAAEGLAAQQGGVSGTADGSLLGLQAREVEGCAGARGAYRGSGELVDLLQPSLVHEEPRGGGVSCATRCVSSPWVPRTRTSSRT